MIGEGDEVITVVIAGPKVDLVGAAYAITMGTVLLDIAEVGVHPVGLGGVIAGIALAICRRKSVLLWREVDSRWKPSWGAARWQRCTFDFDALSFSAGEDELCLVEASGHASTASAPPSAFAERLSRSEPFSCEVLPVVVVGAPAEKCDGAGGSDHAGGKLEALFFAVAVPVSVAHRRGRRMYLPRFIDKAEGDPLRDIGGVVVLPYVVMPGHHDAPIGFCAEGGSCHPPGTPYADVFGGTVEGDGGDAVAMGDLYPIGACDEGRLSKGVAFGTEERILKGAGVALHRVHHRARAVHGEGDKTLPFRELGVAFGGGRQVLFPGDTAQ